MSNEDLVRPTVWDRLTGAERAEPARSGSMRRYSTRDVCDSICEEMVRLLNTHNRCTGWADTLDEIDRSSVAFGIADWTGANMRSPEQREELRRSVEDAIRAFEPRLTQVRVAVLEDDDPERAVRLRIEGRLAGDTHEPVCFESQADVGTSRMKVVVADA